MKDHWKDRNKPTLDHILELFSNAPLGAYIAGHLILESVLVQLIELKLTEQENLKPFDLSFHQKVSVAASRDLIDEEMASFLRAINALRNRLAHRLGEPITFDVVFSLAQQARRAGVEFSDDTIHMDKKLSEEHYRIEGVIQEIFQNTAQDLSFIMEQHGGEFQFC
ncbi:MAG: hypothetical protein AAGL69_10710 [Pseudomonadota bacterium]